MSFLRGDPDIDTSVRKAISPEETAPKRKHVRACVVYSWDHRDGKAFWHAVRMLPLFEDPVMTFKALIVIHKVLHEGHKSILREAQRHVEWIRSLANSHSSGGYRRLIDEYVRLLLHKLEFHRHHPDFNGTFEYEEYITLRNVDDPNDGYESVIDLMNLQDSIDDYQRLLFASIGGGRRNGGGPLECRVSSLTAMVTESYGIYRFVTSMLRALYQQSDPEVLEPLVARYKSQHRRLRNFYFEAQGIKYLATLISIPELDRDPPDLTQSNDKAPKLPKRPRELQPMSTGATSSVEPMVPEATGNWWMGQQPNLVAQQQEQAQQQAQMEAYQQQLEMERQQQQAMAMQAQQQFEAEQAQLLAQQQAQQEEVARLQAQQQQAMQFHSQSQHAQAVEQEMALLRSQQSEAQSMLQQYDQRVQSLEADLSQITSLTQQQIDAKTQQINNLQEQVDSWRQKYESLARLYSQLRHEHLEAMAKQRKLQTKASSAQEAVEKREKAERDLKAKNLELADLIRERDRARYELDKARGNHSEEVEKLERNISLLNDRVSDHDRSRSDVGALEALLAAKEAELSQANSRSNDDEVDILREQLSQVEAMVGGMSLNNTLGAFVDAALQAAYETVQRGLTALESPLENGNPNATPQYVLSIVETAISSTEQFCDVFMDYVAEGAESDPKQIINSSTTLANSLSDLLSNSKGLAGLTAETESSELVLDLARESGTNVCTFLNSLTTEFLQDLPEEDKIELVTTYHVEVRKNLQDLGDLIEDMMPRANLLASGTSLNQQVDGAMSSLADAVAQANKRLTQLMDSSSLYKIYDKAVNEAIIAAAAAITSAMSELIRAAIVCQRDIVARGQEGESPENYYKRNHRWTEGLISAAKAVGSATNVLIETADGTLSGRGSPEELIVSSREVASSIAQLVAASRVKAGYMSNTQQDLEVASKHVTTSCRALVERVEEIIFKNRPDPKMVDYSKLSPMDFKSTSMEQQVEVLKLEQELTLARNRLFEIRKLEYVQREEEDVVE